MDDLAEADRGAILRELRRRAGLSQARLAQVAGVSERTIRTLENGRSRTPHRSTLLALARGLRADPDQTRRLLLLTRQERAKLSFSELIAGGADLTTAMAEADVRINHARRVISSHRHIRVAASRRVRSIEEHVAIEAVRDGVGTHLVFQDGDQSLDARLFHMEALEGCRLVAHHLFEPWNASLFELSLDNTLAKGQTHLLSFRMELGGDPPEDPDLADLWHRLDDSDGMINSFSWSVPVHTLRVSFEGEPPARVWELGGVKEPERVGELCLDSWNSAHFVKQHGDPGTYGIEWAWA